MLPARGAQAEFVAGRHPQNVQILLKLGGIHAGALKEPQFVKVGVPAVGLAVVDFGGNDPALNTEAGLKLLVLAMASHPAQGVLDKGKGVGQEILTTVGDGEGWHQHLTTLGQTLPHGLLDLVGTAFGNLGGAYRAQPGQSASLQPDIVTRQIRPEFGPYLNIGRFLDRITVAARYAMLPPEYLDQGGFPHPLMRPFLGGGLLDHQSAIMRPRNLENFTSFGVDDFSDSLDWRGFAGSLRGQSGYGFRNIPRAAPLAHLDWGGFWRSICLHVALSLWRRRGNDVRSCHHLKVCVTVGLG